MVTGHWSPPPTTGTNKDDYQTTRRQFSHLPPLLTEEHGVTMTGLQRRLLSILGLLLLCSSLYSIGLASRATGVVADEGLRSDWKAPTTTNVPPTIPIEKHPLDYLKVPTPIFVASLPKSGTTSVARYFYCGQIWTAHTFVNTDDKRQLRVGECFKENVDLERPSFQNCGAYKVYSDNGFVRGKRCFYPSVHGLDHFAKWYPNATILLVKRQSWAWRESIQKWKGGNLLKKWLACDKFPRKNANDTAIEAFYEEHAQRIRDFARSHPSLTYIEIQLEDDNVAEQLEGSIGVNASCWGHHNSHEKRLRLNPRFREEWNRTQAKLLAANASSNEPQ